ncbi:MAG TPA: DNA alkylation repair protein [Rhodanobacteraceae bacterium]|nr:DNA alkylation repair protein [Rhodanobacteraceae bacterium]
MKAPPTDARVREAIAWLKRKGSKAGRDGMARYAIPSDRAFGVSMKDVQALGKTLGRDHTLALALWDTGCYEARALCAYVDEPARVTAAQMDRWCRDFDNWATCDTLCFALFDRTPHAWRKVAAWTKRKPEFERRAGLALLASLALHDKDAEDARFLALLPLVERVADDERNFVHKAASWALRSIGSRNATLHAAAIALAKRLAASDDRTARATGKEVVRELARPAVQKRLARSAKR